MANPQKENGYTAIANEIQDVLAKTDLEASQRRVLDVIFRKTYGYNKKSDDISISQIVDATGLSKRTAIYATQNLEAKNIITVKREGHDTNAYTFQKDYEKWVVQRIAPGYEKMLKARREKYNKRGSATKAEVVQPKPDASATKPVSLVQRRDKKGRFVAHTKAKSNKAITKTRERPRTEEKPVKVLTGEEIGQARSVAKVIEAFTKINPACKNMYGNTVQRKACVDLIEEFGYDRVMMLIDLTLPKTNKLAFFPTITTPHQLFQDYAKLEAAMQKYKNKVETTTKARGLA